MRFASTLVFAGMATAIELSGHAQSFNVFGVQSRQVHICSPIPPPYTCERSCGPGYVQCVDFPNCYNPGLGQKCCSNGEYCDKGTYCTDGGCCPDGTPLSECGTKTLGTIAPPKASPKPVSSSSSSSAPPVSTVEKTSTSTSTSTETETETKSPSTPPPPPPPPATGTAPLPTGSAGPGVSGTGIFPPIQTAGAGERMYGGALQCVVGGLGLLFML